MKEELRDIALSVARNVQQVGQYTKETGLNKRALMKLVLQLALNAGKFDFNRGDALDVLEQSLPMRMNKSQKLNHVSNMLKAMQADGLLTKTGSGKQWLITAKGKVELEG